MVALPEQKTYSVSVGNLWVTIDFEARAVSVTRPWDLFRTPVSTEELGNGVLIDRDEQGRIVTVEVIGAGEEVGR